MNCVGAVVLLALAMAYLPSDVVADAFRSPCQQGALGSAPLQHSAKIRDLAIGSLSHTPLALILLRTVVPVSVEPCDFGIRVETQKVAVRDVYVLALLYDPRNFCRYGPAHFSLDHDCLPVGRDQFDHFDSKVRNGIRKRAPNNIDATTDRHDAFAAVWGISSQCAICAKSEHAINVVGIVRSEELLGS